MSKNVIICVAISGSGKSSWTKEFISQHPHYIRCNRDSFRELLVPNHISTWYNRIDRNALENLVTILEESLIHNTKHDVVLDNTNCRLSDLKAWIEWFNQRGITFLFKLIPTGVSTAQSRVMLRDGHVEYSRVEYIQRQWDQLQATRAWIEENYKDKII